jgi:hypothetical protein
MTEQIAKQQSNKANQTQKYTTPAAKLAKLEQQSLAYHAIIDKQREELIKQLIEEKVDIISKLNAYSIDNTLLAGAFLFLLDKNNESNPILQQFRDLAAKHKVRIPKRRR